MRIAIMAVRRCSSVCSLPPIFISCLQLDLIFVQPPIHLLLTTPFDFCTATNSSLAYNTVWFLYSHQFISCLQLRLNFIQPPIHLLLATRFLYSHQFISCLQLDFIFVQPPVQLLLATRFLYSHQFISCLQLHFCTYANSSIACSSFICVHAATNSLNFCLQLYTDTSK